MLENEIYIIKQAQSGNSEYFGLLYDHYLAAIYRFVFLKTGQKADTQDLVHEIFLNAWKNIEDYDHQGHPFSSWLYQIARNKVIDHYRTKKMNLDIDQVDEDAFKTVMVIEKNLDREKNMELVQKALKRLGEEQQTVLIMRFVEDLSYKETANVLDKSEGAIRLIQHRAIQNLKKIINSDEQFI